MRQFLLCIALLVPTLGLAEEVTIRATMAGYGIGTGELIHERKTVSASDAQPIIRANQDTLYSAIVMDLSQPAVITLPQADGRFQSMLVISQDHYNFVEASPGTYKLTEEAQD